jgi:hypothetical protein
MTYIKALSRIPELRENCFTQTETCCKGEGAKPEFPSKMEISINF